MSDEVQKAYADLREFGTATVVIIHNEQMPGLYNAALSGDQDAQMRLNVVGQVVPQIAKGDHNCVLCGNAVGLNEVAAMAFLSKEIKPGADMLWTLVCSACDDRDDTALGDKVVAKIGFKRLLHEAGHA